MRVGAAPLSLAGAAKNCMKLRPFEQPTRAQATTELPALHALAVAPAVGSIVLLFVAVGFIATACGALAGLAGRPYTGQPGRGKPR